MIKVKLSQLIDSYGLVQQYAQDQHVPMKIHWRMVKLWEAINTEVERYHEFVVKLNDKYSVTQTGPNQFQIFKDGKDENGDPAQVVDEKKTLAYNKEHAELVDSEIELPGDPFVRNEARDDFSPRLESAPPLPFSVDDSRRLNWFIVEGITEENAVDATIIVELADSAAA